MGAVHRKMLADINMKVFSCFVARTSLLKLVETFQMQPLYRAIGIEVYKIQDYILYIYIYIYTRPYNVLGLQVTYVRTTDKTLGVFVQTHCATHTDSGNQRSSMLTIVSNLGPRLRLRETTPFSNKPSRRGEIPLPSSNSQHKFTRGFDLLWHVFSRTELPFLDSCKGKTTVGVCISGG